MASKKKPKRKPVMAWALLLNGEIEPAWIYLNRDAALFSPMNSEGVVRVRITPVTKRKTK